MYKIAILGCENSHANTFLDYIIKELKGNNVKVCGGEYSLDGLFEQEFESFNKLLLGGEMRKSYEDFFAPVFILNAINRSIESGNEEQINRGVTI